MARLGRGQRLRPLIRKGSAGVAATDVFPGEAPVTVVSQAPTVAIQANTSLTAAALAQTPTAALAANAGLASVTATANAAIAATPIARRTLASNTAASSATVSSISVTPTGQQENDWMLAFAASVGGANTISSASGWTEVGTQVTHATTTTGSFWKKKAGVSEAGPYQWDGLNARRMGVIILAYVGADPTDMVDGSNVSSEGATAQQLDHDSLTPGSPDNWHILGTCSNSASPDDNAVHFNQPANYVEQAEIASTHATSANVHMALADRELPDASATGVQSVTIDGGINRALVGLEVIIRAPSANVSVNAGIAAVTAAAQPPTIAIAVNPTLASVTTTSQVPTIGISTQSQLANVTAAALKEDVEGVPDAIVAALNLSGPVTTLWDDPTAPDAGFLTAVDGSLETNLRVSFPTPVTPPGSGGPKVFRVWVRRTSGSGANPTVYVDLWENGSFRERLTIAVITSTTGQLITGTMNPALLTSANGSAVELRIQGIPNSPSEFEPTFPSKF